MTITIAGTSTGKLNSLDVPGSTNGSILSTETSIPLGKIATPFVKLIGDSGQTTSGTVMGSKVVTFDESNAGHFDPNNFFNSSTNRIVPTIAGYYFVSFTMEILSATRSGPTIGGAASTSIDFRNDNASFSSLPTTISNIGYFDGSTNYVGFNSRSNPGSRTVDFATVNFFLIKAD